MTPFVTDYLDLNELSLRENEVLLRESPLTSSQTLKTELERSYIWSLLGGTLMAEVIRVEV